MAANSGIDLAVFDMAGTLIEDTGIVVRSFSQAFELSDISASEEAIQQLRGASKRDVIRHFVSRQPGQDAAQAENMVEEIYQAFRRMLEENYRNKPINPIHGAEDTLDWLRSRDILIATTTGFYREVRDLILETLGWDGSFFDCNVCSDDVPKGRPAPYMIFQCMSCLKMLDVNRVIKTGDTPLDMQAGCNAGCRGVIGVLTGAHGIGTLGITRHTHIIPSVANLPALLEAGL
ncbi:HAD hydrolase-like protein [Candidatus Poribacteria bacterium]